MLHPFVRWIFAVLALFMSEVLEAQIMSPCLDLERRAVDSLTDYILRQRVNRSTIEASLRLTEAAIECDSTSWSSRGNKITILATMGEYEKALRAVDDEFIRSKGDSSYLVSKPPFYEELEMYDSAKLLYVALSRYFEGLRKKYPDNENIIYRSIYIKFKAHGWKAVKGDIDYYKGKYPSDSHLLMLLRSIHP